MGIDENYQVVQNLYGEQDQSPAPKGEGGMKLRWNCKSHPVVTSDLATPSEVEIQIQRSHYEL